MLKLFSKPLVSIIVPVYKTEDYLEECLDSILAQKYKNIEILCVNDASPDNSQEILEKFATKDARIRVLTHPKNKGLGAARNTGLKNANGEFIAGVDSDDWIEPTMISRLVRRQKMTNADIVVCGYTMLYEDLSPPQPVEPRLVKKNVNIKKHSIFSLVNPPFWNKLWRRSLFVDNGIEFPDRIYFEDNATTPKLVAHSKVIKRCRAYLYNYRIREASIMNSHSDRHINDYIAVVQILQEFLLANNLWAYQSKHFYKATGGSLLYIKSCIDKSKLNKSNKSSLLKHADLVRKALSEAEKSNRTLKADDFKRLMKPLKS